MLAFGWIELPGIFKVLLVLHILTAIVGLGCGDAQRALRGAGAEAAGPARPRGVRGELRGVDGRARR